MLKTHKKFSKEKEVGNRGEALFESLITTYAIPHKIEASKDIGVDYLCEWKNEEKPTGLIFAVQVKTYPSRRAKKIGIHQRLNMLDTYEITPTISINNQTQEYWSLLGMPCYLFVVIPNGNFVDLFYKRYTPVVNGKVTQSRSAFYKANDGLRFLAFSDDKRKVGGFARDLYIDQMRSNYNKSLIAYLNPRKIGLMQFPDNDTDVYFKDIFQEYKTNFENTFAQLCSILGDDDKLKATPSTAPDDDD